MKIHERRERYLKAHKHKEDNTPWLVEELTREAWFFACRPVQETCEVRLMLRCHLAGSLAGLHVLLTATSGGRETT